MPLGAQVIINATVSVDSFFLISAALFSYLYIAKKTSPRQSFIVVAFRYLRLTVGFKLDKPTLHIPIPATVMLVTSAFYDRHQHQCSP